MFETSVLVDPVEVFPDLAAVVDALPTRAPRGGTAVDAGTRVRAALALSRRVQAWALGYVAAFDDQGYAEAWGSRSTGGFIAAHEHLDPAGARRMVVAARTADRMPALGAMLAAGDIGVEHVTAVAAGASRVPEQVLISEDRTFAELAASAHPAQLRLAGQHLQALYDRDAVERDALHVRDSRHLTLSPTFGDAWHLEGLLTPEDGTALAVALDSLMAPNGVEDDRTVTQRRADALVELTEVALRSGALPDCGGDRPRVTLLVEAGDNPFGDPADDADGVQVTAFDKGDGQLLASTALLPTATLARICCDAEINLTTLDSTGQILNQGRTTRTPSLAQRRALVVRDRGCVFPGCEAPARRCQAHHLVFWRCEGPTDLDNLALVCSFHHHLVHEHHWALAPAPPSADHPMGGWTATAPDGHQLRHYRC